MNPGAFGEAVQLLPASSVGTGHAAERPVRAGIESASRADFQQGRLILVDFARVLAILFMIQGHALDVLLAPTYRQGAIFNGWLFLRGLTAPMFFTLSGVSFTLASLRRWDSYSRPTPALFRRLGRFAFFIVLGYALHWPAKSLHDFHYLDLAGWQAWLQVDVLQCIGMTLLLLQTAVVLGRTPKRFAAIAGAASTCFVLATPLIWTFSGIQRLPLSLGSYFNAQTGSLFPLFPWSAYVFFGATMGFLYVQWHAKPRPNAIWPLAFGGVGLILCGLCFDAMPARLYTAADFWRTSPDLFLIRIGCVCVLLAILACVVRTIRIPGNATHSLAQESLSIYFVHNCFLYGSIWNTGLRQRIGANLAPLPTLLWITVIVLSMILLAWTWNWFKKHEPRGSRLFRAALFVAVAYSLM